MNNSSLASEYLTKAFRYLKEAKQAYEEGDLTGSIRHCYDVIQNISRALLSLYGFYTLEDHEAQMLNLIVLKASEKGVKLIRELQLYEQKLYPLLFLDESSLKSGSVIARNYEVKGLVQKAENLFELANEVFDEFHN
jgi:HEPN domain-containing protein